MVIVWIKYFTYFSFSNYWFCVKKSFLGQSRHMTCNHLTVQRCSWSDALTTVTTKNPTLMEKVRLVECSGSRGGNSSSVCRCVFVTVTVLSLQTFSSPKREQFNCRLRQFKCSSAWKRSSLPFYWGPPLTHSFLLDKKTCWQANKHQAANIKTWWSWLQGLHLLILPQYRYPYEALKMQLDSTLFPQQEVCVSILIQSTPWELFFCLCDLNF